MSLLSLIAKLQEWLAWRRRKRRFWSRYFRGEW